MNISTLYLDSNNGISKLLRPVSNAFHKLWPHLGTFTKFCGSRRIVKTNMNVDSTCGLIRGPAVLYWPIMIHGLIIVACVYVTAGARRNIYPFTISQCAIKRRKISQNSARRHKTPKNETKTLKMPQINTHTLKRLQNTANWHKTSRNIHMFIVPKDIANNI